MTLNLGLVGILLLSTLACRIPADCREPKELSRHGAIERSASDEAKDRDAGRLIAGVLLLVVVYKVLVRIGPNNDEDDSNAR